MKYVITMVNGEYQAPVPMDEFLGGVDYAWQSLPLKAWLDSLPYIDNAGTHFLVDLPV